MDKINFSVLKDRVIPLTLSYSQDGEGGYKETWNPHSSLWAGVSQCKTNRKITDPVAVGQMLPLKPFYNVIIRIKENFEEIKGFLWKGNILRVVVEPSLEACGRFARYRTLVELKDVKDVTS